MHIKLKLVGVFKSKMPSDGRLAIGDDTSIADVLRTVDVPSANVHVVTLNGKMIRDLEWKLSDGDELVVLPPVAGG